MNTVNIYTNARCGACDMAKTFMIEEGIEYTEHRIDKDEDAMKYLVELGVRGVPYFEIGESKFTGYAPSRILDSISK